MTNLKNPVSWIRFLPEISTTALTLSDRVDARILRVADAVRDYEEAVSDALQIISRHYTKAEIRRAKQEAARNGDGQKIPREHQ